VPEINTAQVRATAEYLASLVGSAVVELDMPDEIFRLRRLVGDEDVDTQWRGLSRSDVIAFAEEHYEAAQGLRVERAALWELLKHAVRAYRQSDDVAMAELGDAERERESLAAEIDRLGAELEQYTGGHDRMVTALDLTAERQSSEVIAAALRTIRDVVVAVDSALAPKPSAEPRRWVAGAPEPEIGTTVRQSGDWGSGATYTRRHNGWHTDGECPADCEKTGGSWKWMTTNTAGLVEVVSTDDARG
jgi:hypothetical protein